MADVVRFTVPGVPIAKARARSGRTRAGKTIVYADPRTQSFEAYVRFCCPWKGAPMEGPLGIEVFAGFPIPASWSKREKESAGWHTNRPDADNLLKVVADAVQGLVFLDDKQLAKQEVTKRYTTGEPGMLVTIWRLDE